MKHCGMSGALVTLDPESCLEEHPSSNSVEGEIQLWTTTIYQKAKKEISSKLKQFFILMHIFSFGGFIYFLSSFERVKTSITEKINLQFSNLKQDRLLGAF